MKEFQRNLNTIVIYNSNTDLGGNSNSNLLIFNVIVIYYIDLGSNCNSNSNILIFKVIVIYYIAWPCLLITITYIAKTKNYLQLWDILIYMYNRLVVTNAMCMIHITLVTTIWVFLQNEQLSSIVA